jgi:mono/diheme cytochrome c family protein
MRFMEMPMNLIRILSAATLLAATAAQATTPAELLTGYQRQAGVAASAARGQAFFTSRHGGDWACASCHGERPVGAGRHANTGKPIEPLAPAANGERFTDAAKVEKWFRRNCRDVLQRECSAGEKADVLAYLSGLAR